MDLKIDLPAQKRGRHHPSHLAKKVVELKLVSH